MEKKLLTINITIASITIIYCMKNLYEELDIPIEVYNSETHMTRVFPMALEGGRK